MNKEKQPDLLRLGLRQRDILWEMASKGCIIQINEDPTHKYLTERILMDRDAESIWEYMSGPEVDALVRRNLLVVRDVTRSLEMNQTELSLRPDLRNAVKERCHTRSTTK